VGSCVGLEVGSLVGFVVGSCVGLEVGSFVGFKVGSFVGTFVGFLVVGLEVGSLVGLEVGIFVGLKLEEGFGVVGLEVEVVVGFDAESDECLHRASVLQLFRPRRLYEGNKHSSDPTLYHHSFVHNRTVPSCSMTKNQEYPRMNVSETTVPCHYHRDKVREGHPVSRAGWSLETSSISIYWGEDHCQSMTLF